jgi:hypothetical protein
MRKTIGFALIALVAGVALLWHAVGDTDAPTSASKPAPAGASEQPPSNRASAPDPALPRIPAQAANSAYPVDLDRLRERLPDNLYWTLGAPTDDKNILAQRAERARQSNELFGKVQSNTASEEEIHRYYADRRRMSEDYIQFAQAVLAEYRSALPEKDIGLYELSVNLHRARLAEIPRNQNDALARLREKRARGK